jgi:hypothetical protein
MLVRHYVHSREYRRRLMAFLGRMLWRTLSSTNRHSFQAMLRVTLDRAVSALPMILKAWRLGVRLPMTLQVADEVACRTACASYCFTAFFAQARGWSSPPSTVSSTRRWR